MPGQPIKTATQKQLYKSPPIREKTVGRTDGEQRNNRELVLLVSNPTSAINKHKNDSGGKATGPKVAKWLITNHLSHWRELAWWQHSSATSPILKTDSHLFCPCAFSILVFDITTRAHGATAGAPSGTTILRRFGCQPVASDHTA